MTALIVVAVFFAAAVTDLVWTRYTLAVAAKRPAGAAFWSIGIFVLGSIGVRAYISNPWLLIPVALGGAAGTYVAVRHAAR